MNIVHNQSKGKEGFLWIFLGGGKGGRDEGIDYTVLFKLRFFFRFSANCIAKMHFCIENCPLYILYLHNVYRDFSEVVKDVLKSGMLVTDAVDFKFSLYLKIVMCISKYRLELKLMI